jgi:hypothetical protein
MQVEQIFRDGGELPAAGTNAVAPRARDFGREADDCDAQLNPSLNHLADLYRATDVVNHGAQ